MDIFSLILALKIILGLVIIIWLLVLFFTGWSIYTILTTRVPWAKISEDNVYKIFKELNLPKGSLVYDLGCGDGRVLFAAEKMGYRILGYELSLYPYLKARLKKYFSQSAADFKRRDFFKADLSQADAIFIFLVSTVMEKVGKKLKTELKHGALVISYGFNIPGWKIEKTINTKPSLTYVYKVK